MSNFNRVFANNQQQQEQEEEEVFGNAPQVSPSLFSSPNQQVLAVSQKTQPTNRRIFEDYNQRGAIMRTSAMSFNNQPNEQQQQQQQQQNHQRIFQQSPLQQRNKNARMIMMNDHEIAGSPIVSENTRNDSYQQEQDVLKQMYEQQQLTQDLPQFTANSNITTLPTSNPKSQGIKLLKNSQISSKQQQQQQQSDQQDYFKTQAQLSQMANSNHTDLSSDLITFGGAQPKQQQQKQQQYQSLPSANMQDASQFNEPAAATTATISTNGAQYQPPEQQLIMPIQYSSLPQLNYQQQQQQQPLKAFDLPNAVNNNNAQANHPPTFYGLNSYNRITEQTYPLQYPHTQNNNILSQQQSPVKSSSSSSSNHNGIIAHDNMPAGTKTIILSESEYQKLLQDQRALADELVNTQVLVKQLNQTIAEINKKNNLEQSRHNQRLNEEQDQEIAVLQNHLKEKDSQLAQVIQQLRDAQEQLGQFADQVLSLKARLNEQQRGNELQGDQEGRMRQLQAEQLQYSQQNQQSAEQTISSSSYSSPGWQFAPAKNLDQRKKSENSLGQASAALTQGRLANMSNTNQPSDMQITTKKGMNQNRLTLCTKMPKNQFNS